MGPARKVKSSAKKNITNLNIIDIISSVRQIGQLIAYTADRKALILAEAISGNTGIIKIQITGH
jgi:hypothetical protein